MTVQEAIFFMLPPLRSLYGEGEASQMTDMVMEHITGSGKAERMQYKQAVLTAAEEEQVRVFTARLLKQEPVQYVLGEAWFCGLRFGVNEHVLIPRPETEELVEWVISHCRFPVDTLRILDIGTGSGCIAIALKRRLRKAEVWGCDISPEALDIAGANSKTLGAPVHWVQADILDRSQWSRLPAFDIIISNPPYIPLAEKETLAGNVAGYEPGGALFVPDEKPLLFYETIAAFAREHGVPGGALYFEIHENRGAEVMALLEHFNLSPEMKKDMQQKDRMVRSGL